MLSVTSRGMGAAVIAMERRSLRVRMEVRRGMERIVRLVERDVKQKGLTGRKVRHHFWGVMGAEGNALGARSGRTRQSVTARVIDAGPAIIGVVGTPAKHAKIHEHGGTIYGSPYLRIPTAAAQTGAGVDRYIGQSARALPGGFIFRSKAGNLWIATREGAQLVLQYLLKRSVTLRARKVFATSLERMRPAIGAEVRNAVARIAGV